MSDILQKILLHKAKEVEGRRKKTSIDSLQEKIQNASPVRGFIKAIRDDHAQGKFGVIAEIKKASPSKGIIRENFNPKIIAKDYAKNGASCLSVLTDEQFFQGKDAYLIEARNACDLPVLRKDFMVDPYQIIEARVMGADAVLLIAAALTDEQLHEFERVACECQLDVLVEVHNQDELQRALTLKTPLLGINNRNLRTFATSLSTTIDLLKMVPKGKIVVSESGIYTKEDIKILRNKDVKTVLIGEAFMRQDSPGKALKELFD